MFSHKLHLSLNTYAIMISFINYFIQLLKLLLTPGGQQELVICLLCQLTTEIECFSVHSVLRDEQCC